MKKLYVVKVTQCPVSQNVGKEVTFLSSNIEKTMDAYLRNRQASVWEIVDIHDVKEGMDEFDKNSF